MWGCGEGVKPNKGVDNCQLGEVMLVNCVFGVLRSGLNTQCDVLPAWLVVYTFSTLGSPGFSCSVYYLYVMETLVNLLLCSFSYLYLNVLLFFGLT